MLYPRIIPCLLVHNKGLVKTVKFRNPKYVGDPINAVKIFNEKEVDELIVLDIDASVEKKAPNLQMIKNLATECRMPLCYGGGIKTVAQAQEIFGLGVEKIAVSSLAVEEPNIIYDIIEKVGSQSVVVVLDIKKKKLSGKYEIYLHNGNKSTGLEALNFAEKVQAMGVGEIVINMIDQDGMMKGYDLKFIKKIREILHIPMTVLGGAGSMEDMGAVIQDHGIIGVAAGSNFVFKGKFKAVLINYPTISEKEKFFEENFINKFNR